MSRVYPYEVEMAVSYARRAQDQATRDYDTQLAALLEEYAGRRSATAEVVRQVADLAVGHAAESDRRAEQLVEQLMTGNIAITERLETDRDRLRDEVNRLNAVIGEKRTLNEKREAREKSGEQVQVTIDRSLGGWTVADLEEVAYRLRCGGAVDDTAVKVTDYSATALVPAPDLVRLVRPTREPEPSQPLPEPTTEVASMRWPWRYRLAALGCGAGGALVTAVLR